jgi:hypothetical protein
LSALSGGLGFFGNDLLFRAWVLAALGSSNGTIRIYIIFIRTGT